MGLLSWINFKGIPTPVRIPQNGDLITIVEALDRKGSNAYKGYSGIVEDSRSDASFVVKSPTSSLICLGLDHPTLYFFQGTVYKTY